MKRKIILLSLVLSFLSLHSLSAQRLIPGQVFASAYASCWSQYGVDLGGGLVYNSGKLFFKASYLTCKDETYHVNERGSIGQSDYRPANDFQFAPQDMLFSGGYLARIVSDRKRMLNFYLGGTLDLGARFLTYRESVDSPSDFDCPSCQFIIGLSPTVEFEVFPTTSFAINIYYKPRVQFLTNTYFYNEFGIGCTYYFFAR